MTITTAFVLDGFEHGVTGAPAAAGGGICASQAGTWTITTSNPRGGGTYGQRSLQINPTAATGYLRWTPNNTNRNVVRFGLRFNAIPASGTNVTFFTFSQNGGADFTMRINGTSSKIEIGATTFVASTNAVTTNTWYLLDLDLNLTNATNATNNTYDWKIDGVTQTQALQARAADTCWQITLGAGASATCNIQIDDLIITNTGSDYPIGDSYIVGLSPDGVGTHSFTANDFSWTSDGTNYTNISSTSDNRSAQLGQIPMSGTSNRIRQTVIRTTGYLEHTLEDLPANTSVVNEARGYVTYMSTATTANQGATGAYRASDSTYLEIYGNPTTRGDMSETTAFTKSANLVLNGTTAGEVNGLTIRTGYSGDVTPNPHWLSVLLQVDITVASGTTYPVSVAGAMTPAGALTRRPGKALGVGTVTAVGVLARQAGKALAGTATPAGAVTKRPGKALTGAVSSSATLSATKVVMRSFAGTMTSAGALTRRAGKALAGAITPAGDITYLAAQGRVDLSAGNTVTVTTASFTPPANCRMYAAVRSMRNNHSANESYVFADSLGGSWTTDWTGPAQPNGASAFARRFAIGHRDIGGSPSAMTVTADAWSGSADTGFYCLTLIFAPAGTTFAQTPADAFSGTAAAVTPTLAGASTRPTYCVAVAEDDNGVATWADPEAGWSMVVRTTIGYNMARVTVDADGDASGSTSVDWVGTSEVSTHAVIFELQSATTTPINLSGALSSAGTLARRPGKALAGAATPAGALTRRPAKTLAGTATSSGALATSKVIVKALAGALSSAGVLTRQPGKSLAGAVTSAGVLVRRPGKGLAGTLTSSGTAATVRALLRSFAGTLTSSGALANRPGKALAGTATSAGVLTRRPAKALAGTLTISATLASTKAFLRSFTGTLTSSGTLTKRPGKALGGIGLAGTPQQIIVPLYTYPATGFGIAHWDAVTGVGAPAIYGIIADPDNGPGSTADPNYVTAIANAQAAGIRVFGYVNTDYGNVPAATIDADVDAWWTLYGLRDIFYDLVAPGSGLVSFYAARAAHVRSNSASSLLIYNPGASLDEGYVSQADIVCNFEGDMTSYLGWTFDAYTKNYPPSKWWHLVHGVPTTQDMQAIVALSKGRNAKWLDVTDDVFSPGAWDTAPTYLTAEATAVQSPPVGALTRRAGKALAGTLTSSASLVRRPGKALVGTVSASGTLARTKVALRAMAGTLVPSGTLTRRPGKALAGTLTPAGVLTTAQTFVRALAGTLTSAGTLTKRPAKSFAGTVTSSGTVARAKVALRSIGGTLTSAGALTRRTLTTKSGTLDIVGTLTKRPAKAFAGTLTSSGTVVRSRLVFRSFAGTSTSVGTLTRQTRKTLTGSVTSSATLVRLARLTLGGTLTSSSSLLAKFLNPEPWSWFISRASTLRPGTARLHGNLTSTDVEP